jgi:hypothetical protein
MIEACFDELAETFTGKADSRGANGSPPVR